MEKEESIDLRQLLQIIMHHKKVLGTIVVACTTAALIIALLIPKSYESTALVRAKSQENFSLSAAASAMSMLGLNSSVAAPTMVYTEMMKSRAVIEPIIIKLDIPEKEKEELTVKGFVNKNLEIVNTKGTDLIEIKATGKSPEEAKMVASEVVNGFLSLMTELNQSQQSVMVKFLAERIDVLKGEMEQAEQKLEEYAQQEKIYIPEEQAKAAVEKMASIDKMMSQMKVKSESAEVRLQGVRTQLNKQNAAIKEFNIADNETIKRIRNTIIDKQIALVELEQRYTEKHPSVIALREEIVELNKRLHSEVSQSVDSNSNTLNPVQAGLLKEKVETETEIAVNQAGLQAIQALQNKAEEEIGRLSASSLQYVKLARDVKIAQEVYGILVKNYEDARVQQAMNSMDIQIVDPADLPKKPVSKKLLITVIGAILGIMIAFGYTLVLYNRKFDSVRIYES